MTSSKRVLVIEDDEALRTTLVEALRGAEFEVYDAANGEDGIERAQSSAPDLVLLDIVLPKKDGFDVIKALRADAAFKQTPILLLTNLESATDIERALRLGATNYLIKSDYNLAEIVDKVKIFLSERSDKHHES